MFKRLNHKGIPLGDVYDALGKTKNIIELRPTGDELPLMEQILDDDPDEMNEGMPESWVTTFSAEGFIWKDLHKKDVATRAAFVEDKPAKDGEDGEDAKGTFDDKLEALKEEMNKKFEVFKEKVGKSYEGELKDFKKELKKEMKTLVARLVDVEYRKRTAATRGSSYYEGESSRKQVGEEDAEEDEEDAKEDEEDAEEVEKVVSDFDDDTTIGEFKRNVGREKKRRKQN